MVSFWIRLKNLVSSFNLFDNESTDNIIIRCQRLATRIYVFLFLISFIILQIHTCISEQTIIEAIKDPNRTIIEHLQLSYPDTINCPCSQIAIPYNKLVDDNITYHEVPFSSFLKLVKENLCCL